MLMYRYFDIDTESGSMMPLSYPVHECGGTEHRPFSCDLSLVLACIHVEHPQSRQLTKFLQAAHQRGMRYIVAFIMQ
jgi:hypothetical protein